ncbi:integrase [Streptococcus agalactiae]|uniref:Integrase n=1 Tax=Streptococcus agalactiae TaxID=1311 RepID=A0A7Z7KEL9_STRAG|nr:integrase [Streptococcus agalactiae]
MRIESYKKKNGTTAYRFRVYIGVIDGKKKYIKRSGFTSKKLAKQALINLQQEIENPKDKSTLLFKDLTKIWLDNYEKNRSRQHIFKDKKKYRKSYFTFPWQLSNKRFDTLDYPEIR